MLRWMAWLLAAGMLGGAAAQAQDQTPEQTPAQDPAPAPAIDRAIDPAAVLSGLWQVDKVTSDHDTSASLIGRMMRIDSDAVASLTGGTCSSPGFAVEKETGAIAITCVGQILARAGWDGATPNLLHWAEPNVVAELHRVSATPAAAVTQPQGGDAGTGEGATGGSSGDESGSDGESGSEGESE